MTLSQVMSLSSIICIFVSSLLLSCHHANSFTSQFQRQLETIIRQDHRLNFWRKPTHMISSSSSSQETTVTCSVSTKLSREQGQSVLDEKLLPRSEYGNRIGLGRDAQGIDAFSGVITPDDPRLTKTYGEFPLSSLDQLLDLGLQYLDGRDRTTMLDLGSGCGRLVVYSALTRGTVQHPWTIHGIEISNLLHEQAICTLSAGLEAGWFSEGEGTTNGNISFHCGAADDNRIVLGEADLVFAYSTVFSSSSFSPELGAMVLDKEWSELFKYCRVGSVAITTDRALDPAHGWELVDRLDVENPEVFGSTGYIHVRR
jgi:hypothetical protein